MIQRGGVFDKIGNWYEQGLVILQWLRVLSDEAEAVVWEALGEDGEGIDYWVKESGRWIAVQCKTRSSGTWGPAKIDPPLRYARMQLDDRAYVYKFVTNNLPVALKSAEKDAKKADDPTTWLQGDSKNRAKFSKSLGCDVANPEDLSAAFLYFKRIDVKFVEPEDIEKSIWTSAKYVSGSDREKLLYALIRLANEKSLGVEWTSAKLLAALRNLTDAQLINHHNKELSIVWLNDIGDNFKLKIDASLRGRPQIKRDEVNQVIEYVERGEPIVLVHGQPGTGKSIVLAQVLLRLRDEGVPVLAMRADMIMNDRLGPDPVARLSAMLGEGSGCIIVDQLDQAAAIGSQCLGPLTHMIQSAVQADIPVIVGCRSVDAERETSLHQILYHLNANLLNVSVGDYSDQIVSDSVKSYGITLDDLGTDLKVLIKNPLALSLFMDVLDKGGAWRIGASSVELVDAWCRKLAEGYGSDFHELLDNIADLMEQDGLMSVDRFLIESRHSELIGKLIGDGLLIEESDNRIRVFHQVITDLRIALRWAGVTDFSELKELIGDKNTQTLIYARRARLAVMRLINRGASGIEIVAQAIWHQGFRAVLRRSFMLGLADLTTVSPSLAKIIVEWLDDEAKRSLVMKTIVYGQTAWMDALDEYIGNAWSTWNSDQRQLLLDCCSSVARMRGDNVARYLSQWERETSGTLVNAQWVFWHDASEDSDELFKVRLDYLATSPEHFYYNEWVRLMKGNPLRALKLLLALLRNVANDDLVRRSDLNWMHNFPSTEQIPCEMLAMGNEMLNEFKQWWSSVTVEDVEQIWTNEGHEASLVHIVDFFSFCIAEALSEDVITWATLMKALPVEIRDIDAWLLLRVGAYLNADRVLSETAADAVAWFCSDNKWAHLQVGYGKPGRKFDLAFHFLKTTSQRLEVRDYEKLENWLLGYVDDWTDLDEEYRQYVIKRHGNLRPDRFGETVYLLLPALNKSNWSDSAKLIDTELNRKFSNHENMFRNSIGISGYVGPKMPDIKADKQSPMEWLSYILSAPETDDNPTQTGPDAIGYHDRRNVINQMRRLAERTPLKYLELAHLFTETDEEIPDAAFSAMLDGLSRAKPAHGEEDGSESLTKEGFAQILLNPAYLHNKSCAREIAMALDARSDYSWPQSVFERLVDIAHEYVSAFEKNDDQHRDELINYRINNAACVALHALAQMAEHRPERSNFLFSVAEGFIQHQDLGRRAAAALLAWAFYKIDLARAARLVLELVSDEPRVAAQEDVHPVLRYLAQSSDLEQCINKEAQAILLNLMNHKEKPIAEWAGIGALCLRNWDLLSHDAMVNMLADNVIARKTVAKNVRNWLYHGGGLNWLRPYAIDLANDEEPEVGDAIMWAFRGKGKIELLSDDAFMKGLLNSKAAQRGGGDILDACDEAGDLVRLSAVVLSMASELIVGQKGQKRDAVHVTSLLVRLIQESAYKGDEELSLRALGLLDQCIDLELIPSGNVWKLVSHASSA